MNKQGLLSSANSFNSCLSKTRQGVYEVSQLLASSLLLSHLSFIPYVHAGPTGGNVVGGAGTINQSGLNTTINQSSSSMAINWDSYNLGATERVQYIQPDSSSLSLNRILSHNGSEIHGRIDANGQVILVNPNGVFFGPTSQINVGGLIASGLDISPSDFMNGNYIFNEVLGTDGTVINSGLINASLGGASGGNVTLIGKQVKNEGVINAHLGAVNMAAGKQAVLTFDNQGLIGVKISKKILQDELGVDPALINSGEINAESGRVLLTASVSRDVFSQAVNTGDIEQASSVLVNADGSFSLGGGADVINTGSIDVSSITESNAAGDVVIIGENITHMGVIAADTETAVGSTTELHANNTVELRESALITARANSAGVGGKVKVLGKNVGLLDSSVIDVSGANGGGEVLLGGDRRGLNAKVRNADFLYVSENSSIFADALTQGNGGRIIAYADNTARIYGSLFARGGIEAGNGGFIETSGKHGFEILKAPDVSASAGEGGLWLIDPYNIMIQQAPAISDPLSYITDATTIPPDTFYTSIASALTSTIDVTVIEAALASGNVEIITDALDGGGEAGNITFDANLDYDGTTGGTGPKTLTLDAAGNIVFTADSSITDGTPGGDSLNVSLFANANPLAVGSVSLNNGVVIDTQGGDFTVGGIGGNTPSSFTAASSSKIVTSGQDDFDAGVIHIFSDGAISTGILTADAGTTTINDTAGHHGGDITLDAKGIVTVAGAISAIGSVGDDNDTNSSAGQLGGNGGAVKISTTVGDVTVNAITTSGAMGDGDNSDPASGGNAGNITLSAANQLIINGALNALGGNTDSGNGTANGGNGGDVIATGNLILLGNNITTIGGILDNAGTDGQGGNITLNGSVELENNIVFDTDISSATATVNDGTVLINGTINDDANPLSRSLTIDSGTASTTVTGDIGGVTRIQQFEITESSQANVSGIATVGGNVTVNTDSTITLGGSIDTTNGGAAAGNLTLTGNIILDADSVTITTNGSSDTAINIAGSINADSSAASRSLILDAGTSTVDLANVGNLQALQGLTITSGTTSFTNASNVVNTKEGGVSITSTNINLRGNINTDKNTVTNDSGSVSLNGIIKLARNVAIDTDSSGADGSVTFTGTVDADARGNNRTLQITSGGNNVSFTQAAGVGEDLQSLTITSANAVILKEVSTRSGGLSVVSNSINLGGNISTNDVNDAGDVTLNANGGPITLASSVTIDAISSNSDGFINITGAIDADLATNDRALTLSTDSQDITINGDIGVNQAILTLDITNANDVSIDAVNTRSGGVTIDADTVALGGNINTTKDLVSVIAGVVDMAGSDSNPTVTAITLDNNVAITTNSTTDGLVSLSGDVNNNLGTAFDFSIDAGATALTLTNVGAAQAVKSFSVVNSSSTSVGEIGTAGGVVSINTAGGADAIVLLGNINTNNTNTSNAGGAVTLTGPIRLDSDVSINTNAAGSDGIVTFNSDIDTNSSGNQSLSIASGAAAVNLNGDTSATDALLKLSITSTGAVSLQDVNTNSNGGSNGTLQGLDVSAGSINLNGDINTTIDNDAGNVVLNANGGTITLGNAGTNIINTNGSSSTGSISITGNVVANANQVLQLDAGLSGNTDSDITVIGQLGAANAAGALQGLNVLNANDISIDDVNTLDEGVDINANTVSLGGNIDTTFDNFQSGRVQITAPITLEAATSINTNHAANNLDREITLNQVSSGTGGPYQLTLNSGGSDITLNDTVDVLGLKIDQARTTNINGMITTGAAGVDITSTDRINLNADIDTTSQANAGSVFFRNLLNVTGTRRIDTNGSGTDGNVVFVDSVNAINMATDSLTIAAGSGNVDFNGLTTLQFLTVESATKVDLQQVDTGEGIDIDADLINLNNNLTVSANGGINLGTNQNGNVILLNDITLNSNGTVDGNVDIKGTVNSALNENHALTIDSGNGNVSLLSELGSLNALASLDVNSAGSNGVLNLTSVTTAAGAIDVAANLINLQGTLDTSNGVTDSSATGDITISGEINLIGDTVLNTDAVSSATDGQITVLNKASGAQNFDVTSGSGRVQFLDVVGQNGLDNIIAVRRFNVNNGVLNTPGIVDLNSVLTTDGGINLTGSAINLSGDLLSDNAATAGSITLNGNVAVHNDIRIDSGASATSANILFNGNVTADSANNSRLLTMSAGDQNITVNGSLGSSSNSLGGLVIEAASQVSIDEVQVQSQGVDITATNIELGGNVITDKLAAAGAIALNGDVTVAANVIMDTDAVSFADANITVTGAINADNDPGRTLTIRSGTENIDIQGDIGTAALGSLNQFTASNTGVITVAAIETNGASINLFADTLNLNGNLRSDIGADSGFISINSSNVNLLSDVHIDSNSDGQDQDTTIATNSFNGNGNALSFDTGDEDTVVTSAISNLSQFDVQQAETVILNGVAVNGAGQLNINSNNGVSLSGAYSSGSGQITINSDADSSQTGLLTLGANTSLTTVDNIISLTAPALSSGTGVIINSGATAGQVLINSTGDLSLGNAISGLSVSNDLLNSVVANDVQLLANNDLFIDGANSTQTLLVSSVNGDINFSGSDSSLSGITAITVNDVILASNVTSTNAVDITALNINTNSPGGIRSTNSGITLAANLTGSNSLNLTAQNGTVDLQASTITDLDGLSIDADNVQLSIVSPVVTTNDIDLVIRTSNPQYEQAVDLTSTEGQVSLTTTNADLVLNALTTISAQDAVNLTANTGDISVSNVNVTSGSININADNGAIIDNNSTQNNLTASAVVLRANSGIGSGDSIETTTSELDVINNGIGSGRVEIDNIGNVLLTNLVNSGDIDFSNDTNVTIDHVDAGFTVGTVRLNVANGSVFGVNRGGVDFFSVPDITADAAFVTVNGEFGTFERPIVLKLNSEFFLASTISSTFFIGGPPPVVNDTSDLQLSVFDSLNSVSGQQLIEIESIADIDPAIFTELHNYSQKNISIRLPRDQMFDDELENYDRM